MKIMSFDLSTACIGVLTAEVDVENKNIIKMLSCPIIPKKFSPDVLGYLKTKKKLPTKNGSVLTTYVKPGETTISKAEKTRRDREVRAKKDIYVLEEIGSVMGNIIKQIKPDLIIVEKNVSNLNGVLTSILLAKVMGTLLGIAGMLGIPVKEYSVNKARSILNVPKIVDEFTKSKSSEELKTIPDITKRALRMEMQKRYEKYGLNTQTDDEGDSCVIFNYWFTEEFGGKY